MSPAPTAPPEPTRALTEALLRARSITPLDAGCQALIAQRLHALGFDCQDLSAGPADFRVSNLWAIRPPTPAGRAKAATKTIVFAGHTDVVPTGPINAWSSEPFTPTERDGKLYARGAADMKASLAAFVVACEAFLAQHPDTPLALAFLLTSDEEGPARDGTVRVVETLRERGQQLEWCIVGEPTSETRLGDMLKNGRRGSLGGTLSVHGVQGHIAYPHLASNPIHLLAPVLAELCNTHWDAGNAWFAPTSWQVSNIHAGTGATNVIPGQITLEFNFRYSSESTPEQLQRRLCAVLDRHDLRYDLVWNLSGRPFLTPPGDLVSALQAAITEQTGLQAACSTSGGTSDGRFIASLCPQVVEFGPVNASIHKVDEHIAVADLVTLKNIYQGVLTRLHTQLCA